MKRTMIEQCRATLALDASFDHAELKKAHRKLISQWHPDNFPLDSPANAEATEKSKAINAAFETLQKYLGENHAARRNETDNEKPDAARGQREGQTGRRSGNRGHAAGFPDPTVEEIFLTSSHIVSVGYNRFTSMLYIKFSNDTIYRYSSVPESLYDALLIAPSHGAFCRQHIYYRFSHIRYFL